MPTLVTTPYYVPLSPQGTSTLTTTSFTPSNGEVLVVKLCTWDTGSPLGAPTGGGQTYTARVTNAPGGFNEWCAIYTAVISGSPGSMTVSSTPSVSLRGSMVVERWASAQLAATPVTNSANGFSSPAASTITPSSGSSIISWVGGDAQAVDPATRTYLASATQDGLRDDHVGSNGVDYHAYQSSTGTSSQSYGLSAPTGMTWVIAAIEIQDSGGTTPIVDPTWAPHRLVPPGRISPAGFWVPWSGDRSLGGPATQQADAALAVTATFGAAATGTRPADANLSVTTTITAAATGTRPADAALAVTTALAAAATRTAVVDAALPVTTAIAAATTYTGLAAASLAVTTTVAATATASRPADAALSVTTALAAAATRTAIVTASLAVTTTLTAAMTYTGMAAASLAVTNTLVASTATVATASLAITATPTAAAARTSPVDAGLSIAVTLTAATIRTAPVSATLAITTTLAAAIAGLQSAAAVLAVVTSFVAAAASAGSITPRPFTGTTGRPNSGRTSRPFTGTTLRP